MNEKKKLWVLFLALTAILPSCQKEFAEPAPQTGRRSFTFTTAIEAPDTRVATDALVDTEFDLRDQIGVFAVVRSGNEQAYPSSEAAQNLMHNVRYVRQVDGSWLLPQGAPQHYFPQGATIDFYAYYPWAEGMDPTAIEYTAAIAGADFMTARAIGVTEDDAAIVLNFKHKLALVHVEVGGQDALSTMKVEMRNVLHRGTLNLAAPQQADEFTANDETTSIILPNKFGFFCGYIPAQTIPDAFDLFRLNDGGDDMLYKTRAEAVLVSGGIKRYSIVPKAPIADESALPNTYLIMPGSKLSFPVAKAFAAWETNTVLKGAGEDMSGAPSAELVWQDVKGVVKSVSLEGVDRNAVITLETDGAKGAGNALVALKIGGKIFWSWHVWITRYDPNNPENQNIRNNQTMMDRNLGATSSVYGDNGAIGYHYQWGRKDPVPVMAEWPAEETPHNTGFDWVRQLWDIDGNPVTLNYATVDANIETNLLASIQDPLKFITADGSPNDWYSTDVNKGNDRWIGKGNSKTIFDPCPKGWRVPTSGEGSASPWLGMGNPPMWLFGPIWYSGDYYPATGYRSSMTGELFNFSRISYYWSAVAYVNPDDYVGDNGKAYSFYVDFLYSVATHARYSRAMGQSVRCAKNPK
jgi:hypothetical protein